MALDQENARLESLKLVLSHMGVGSVTNPDAAAIVVKTATIYSDYVIGPARRESARVGVQKAGADDHLAGANIHGISE
jgi:hypothetical protein